MNGGPLLAGSAHVRRFAATTALCVLALLCTASLASPQSIPIEIRAGRPVDAARIADYPAALDAILRVMTGRHGLPVPPNATLEVYTDRKDFEYALIDHLGMSPSVARTTAGFAKAAVGARRILVNETEMLTIAWPERLLTLAHEMVHLIQSDLAGERPLNRYQWLIEGHAEWIAFQVMDSLGVEALAKARARMRADVRTVRREDRLPALALLDSLPEWIAVRKERGFNATYPYAFVVMEFLVARHTQAPVTAWFGRFRTSADPAANFHAVFGEDLASFQAALDRNLDALLGTPQVR